MEFKRRTGGKGNKKMTDKIEEGSSLLGMEKN